MSRTHLSKEHGFTKKNILKDKIKISKKFNIVKFNETFLKIFLNIHDCSNINLVHFTKN